MISTNLWQQVHCDYSSGTVLVPRTSENVAKLHICCFHLKTLIPMDLEVERRHLHVACNKIGKIKAYGVLKTLYKSDPD